jgi:hypothetical protein
MMQPSPILRWLGHSTGIRSANKPFVGHVRQICSVVASESADDIIRLVENDLLPRMEALDSGAGLSWKTLQLHMQAWSRDFPDTGKFNDPENKLGLSMLEGLDEPLSEYHLRILMSYEIDPSC